MCSSSPRSVGIPIMSCSMEIFRTKLSLLHRHPSIRASYLLGWWSTSSLMWTYRSSFLFWWWWFSPSIWFWSSRRGLITWKIGFRMIRMCTQPEEGNLNGFTTILSSHSSTFSAWSPFSAPFSSSNQAPPTHQWRTPQQKVPSHLYTKQASSQTWSFFSLHS